jgi:hypothetical protein
MLLRALHNRLGSPWKFTVEALGYYVHVRGITEKEGIVWATFPRLWGYDQHTSPLNQRTFLLLTIQ